MLQPWRSPYFINVLRLTFLGLVLDDNVTQKVDGLSLSTKIDGLGRSARADIEPNWSGKGSLMIDLTELKGGLGKAV
jgi:hypothetical protein